MRNAIYVTVVSEALCPLKEERALLPGDERRPADVFLPNWSGGRDTALDITVVNPLRADFIEYEANTPGYALSQAFNRKMRQIGTACEREGIVFEPLPVETLGGWSSRATKVLRRIGIALASQSRKEEGEVVSHLFQRLSLLLCKGNAALLQNRMPSTIEPEIDGHI